MLRKLLAPVLAVVLAAGAYFGLKARYGDYGHYTYAKVDLPRAQTQQMEHAEEKLVLKITRERKIYLGDAQIPPDQLEAKLATNSRVQKDKEVYLQADRSLPYGLVVQIMAAARRAGVESLGMITEEEKELPKR